ncbi:amylo-alpha-1,6-glucosidase [Chryseolinea lacunae]|uniref:Glycogen debranching enzyme family protein n=1 Tax=Chryseolinea lacunae TaxID=2801331 RepID=A0ABS1KYL1_9BACT|nr:amylo-alpha-1,6-glucosidase [Chryseolinea lacunae]MBL0744504.1 glycogen debranching enzyme family protein [Chryseolinea lacunae]
MKFDNTTLSDFDTALGLEWIEANGLGGYAAGTVSGANARRYHGLLVAAQQPPVGRMVALSKLDETLVLTEGEDTTRIELGTNQYPGVVHPQGYTHLKSFEREFFPVFTYEAGGIELRKTIAAVHGESTTLVIYEVLRAPAPFTLELLPLSSCRDFHSLSHANDYIGRQYLFEDGIFRTLNYQGCPEIFIAVPGATFTEQQGWYYNFEYAVEQQRGLDFQEDLYTLGKFSVTLKYGDVLGVIVSTDDPEGKNALKLLANERKRREKLTEKFSTHASLQQLALAADQFIVKRGALSTILAGYHWFADWGRDTMIALPGLCLTTERFGEAKKILLQFAGSVSEGMLPNRFSDYGEAPEYNTIDATLWYFQAVYHYYQNTEDKSFLKAVMPVLRDIMQWHEKGTRYNIKVDPEDGLLGGGQEGVQLTWMDVKVGDWVVTPRRGKPVEINALWYNALCIMNFLCAESDKDEEAKAYELKAARVKTSFNAVFWNKEQNVLYDYVNDSEKNAELRPNQLYAISLPFPLLTKERAKKVLSAVTKHLLTPRGLRSLSPQDREYCPAYGGDVRSRDGAYHQGTVWSYLLGPYVDAVMVVKEEKGWAEASQLVQKFLAHLNEGCVGTVSEIFDAEAPYAPRGCVAQAWGVGEILRVIKQYGLLEAAPREVTQAKSTTAV